MMREARISGSFALGTVPAFPSASQGFAARRGDRADLLEQRVENHHSFHDL